MNIYIPYTYYLYHYPTKTHYYGARYGNSKTCGIAHPSDFWNTYFTSSKKIKQLRQQYGDDTFYYEIRRTFTTAKETTEWEAKVLKRLNVKRRKEWLNQAYNAFPVLYGVDNPRFGTTHSDKTKRIMSDVQIGEGNSRFKGYWITPWGRFASIRQAVTASPEKISFTHLQRKLSGRQAGYTFEPTTVA